jgi:hypothetical protein
MFYTYLCIFLTQYHIGYDELLTRTLLLTVWNDDLFGRNDFLGEVVIPLGSFIEKGNSLANSTARWHKLCEKVYFSTVTPLISDHPSCLNKWLLK